MWCHTVVSIYNVIRYIRKTKFKAKYVAFASSRCEYEYEYSLDFKTYGIRIITVYRTLVGER
jgi:hypothetical protein